MCLFFWLKNFDGLEKVERSWDIGCLPVFTGFLSPPTPRGRGISVFDFPCLSGFFRLFPGWGSQIGFSVCLSYQNMLISVVF